MIGFYSEDGSLREHLEWGFEIRFTYKNNSYQIESCKNEFTIRNWDDNLGSMTDEVLNVKTSSPDEFLATRFLDSTVEDVINQSIILAIK